MSVVYSILLGQSQWLIAGIMRRQVHRLLKPGGMTYGLRASAARRL